MTKQTLDDLIAKTPKHLEPANDLWPNIESRLDTAPVTARSRHWQMLSIACSFAILLGFGALYWPQDSATNNHDDSVLIMLAQLQQQHQQQVSQLESIDYGTQSGNAVSLVSVNDQVVTTAITELREAAKQIYQALKNDPRDRQILQLWLWTQSRELELLQQTQRSSTFKSATDVEGNSSI